MIIKIAVGIVLGVVLLLTAGILVLILACFFVRLQDTTKEPEQTVHVRIRPEKTKYTETQELVKRAKESNPEHWRDKGER